MVHIDPDIDYYSTILRNLVNISSNAYLQLLNSQLQLSTSTDSLFQCWEGNRAKKIKANLDKFMIDLSECIKEINIVSKEAITLAEDIEEINLVFKL